MDCCPRQLHPAQLSLGSMYETATTAHGHPILQLCCSRENAFVLPRPASLGHRARRRLVTRADRSRGLQSKPSEIETVENSRAGGHLLLVARGRTAAGAKAEAEAAPTTTRRTALSIVVTRRTQSLKILVISGENPRTKISTTKNVSFIQTEQNSGHPWGCALSLHLGVRALQAAQDWSARLSLSQ